jgi:hypothetical protein
MVSDTPETDAQLTTFTSISKLKKHFVNRTGTVSAEFARKLERELREARDTVLKLRRERAAQDKLISNLRTSEQTIVEASVSETNKIERVSQNAVNVLV